VRPEFLGELREERGDPVRLDGGRRDAIHAGRALLTPPSERRPTKAR
jgi:hypothetical protein